LSLRRRLWGRRGDEFEKNVILLTSGEAIGSTETLPYTCVTDPQLLELRLDRGILHGNNAPQPKSKDNSSPYGIALQSNATYGILHRDTRSATLVCYSTRARERDVSEGYHSSQWFMLPPDLVDAEIPLEEDVTEDDDAVES